MGIEPFVFCRENSSDDVARNFFERELAVETLGHARIAQRNSITIQKRDALDRWTEEGGRNGNELEREMSGDEYDTKGRDKPCDIKSANHLLQRVGVDASALGRAHSFGVIHLFDLRGGRDGIAGG